MFRARPEWRRTRLIFDHAEGLLIRFLYSLSWVLCSNYHNCCAKHACLYSWWPGVSVRSEKGIPAPNPINAGQITRHAEGVGGMSGRRGEGPGQGCWFDPQSVTSSQKSAVFWSSSGHVEQSSEIHHCRLIYKKRSLTQNAEVDFHSFDLNFLQSF